MVRKHQGIIQFGGKNGKLKKGYRYTGKRTKAGLPIISASKKVVRIKKVKGGKTQENDVGKCNQNIIDLLKNNVVTCKGYRT